MGRPRAGLLQSSGGCRACEELPRTPEAAPGEAKAAPEPCRAMAVPGWPCWHSCSLPYPTGHSRLPPAGNVPAVPVSSVLPQLFTFNSTNSHFQSKQKDDARCDTCGGENGRIFLWNGWVLSHQGYLWRQQGAVVWAVSTELSLGTFCGAGSLQGITEPRVEQGTQPHSCWVTFCAMPQGLAPSSSCSKGLASAGIAAAAAQHSCVPWPCTPPALQGALAASPTSPRLCWAPGNGGIVTVGAESWGSVLWAQLLPPCLSFPLCEGWHQPAPRGWKDELWQCWGGVRNNKTQ